jgi:hypothetical protein
VINLSRCRSGNLGDEAELTLPLRYGKRTVTNYLIVLSGMLVGYAAILMLLRQRDSFDPKAFVPVLAESTSW